MSDKTELERKDAKKSQKLSQLSNNFEIEENIETPEYDLENGESDIERTGVIRPHRNILRIPPTINLSNKNVEFEALPVTRKIKQDINDYEESHFIRENIPEEAKRPIEDIAMEIVISYERSLGAVRIENVTGQPCGFDILSHYPNGKMRRIEVKGRAGIDDIEITGNEIRTAREHLKEYWLYVVYNCSSSYSESPILYCILNPYDEIYDKMLVERILVSRRVIQMYEGKIAKW